MSASGGSLPPIKQKSLYGVPPHGGNAKKPGGGPGLGQSTDDGWASVGTTSKAKSGPFSFGSRGSATTPPRALIAAAAAIAPLTLSLGPISRTGAVVVGMFVGVAVLGFTRLEINRRISSGRYADWSISATRVASALFVAGWGLGALSMWRLAIEFSRRFT